MASETSRIGAVAHRLIDLALPNRCVGCRRIIGSDGALCAACFAELDFITRPFCSHCGLPLAIMPGGYGNGEASLCAACIATPPRFHGARAALVYGGLARDIVLMLKHADRTDLARPLAQWMVRSGSSLIEQADLIAPVPLHRRRLAARRYNQAGLLAQAIAAQTGMPVAVDLLRRTRPTPSQGRLSASQRKRNVGGAFAVGPRGGARVSQARVLLVDDVMTTGATLDACAAALLRAGAGAVHALVVARVTRADIGFDSPEDGHI